MQFTNNYLSIGVSVIFFSLLSAVLFSCGPKEKLERRVLTKEGRDSMTPEEILAILKEGNEHFQNHTEVHWDHQYEQEQTAEGQYPAAIILSCIDSRAPVELIFNLGIGDVFVARVAGNVINNDVLGSMEYACKKAGSKVILILGHSSCGAVKSACDSVEIGNITEMLAKIHPAMDANKDYPLPHNSTNKGYLDAVGRSNAILTKDQILIGSPILKEMYDNNEIIIKSAVYDVGTANVDFID